MYVPEITKRVPFEMPLLSGIGKGTSSGGISVKGIGLNAIVSSIVLINRVACFSSTLPCTKAIPSPDDHTELTYDTNWGRVMVSVASNNSWLLY